MPHIHKNRDGIATLPAGRILRIGKDFSCVFNAAALILVVFLHSYTWFRGMRQDVLAAGPLLLLLCLPAGLLLGLSSNSKRMRRLAEGIESKFVPFAWGFGAALFVAQLVIANGSWFLTDWDAGALVHGVVYGIQDNFEYFSTYPNQLFLTSLFEMIAHIMPNATYEGVYFELVVGSCLFLSLSTVIVAFIARKLGGVRAALLAFFLDRAVRIFPVDARSVLRHLRHGCADNLASFFRLRAQSPASFGGVHLPLSARLLHQADKHSRLMRHSPSRGVLTFGKESG